MYSNSILCHVVVKQGPSQVDGKAVKVVARVSLILPESI